MKENCINLEVVLADGKVIETAGHGARPRWKVSEIPKLKILQICSKTSAGYNLTELFLGSEGTLGVITQVKYLQICVKQICVKQNPVSGYSSSSPPA